MTAGELADHFPVSRPTMSAHFAVLREADLIESTKIGTTITYQLKLSVLEDALLGFARLFASGDQTSSGTIPAEPQKGPAE
jgi:DNA-binding transcriptional ArsR family regulator